MFPNEQWQKSDPRIHIKLRDGYSTKQTITRATKEEVMEREPPSELDERVHKTAGRGSAFKGIKNTGRVQHHLVCPS